MSTSAAFQAYQRLPAMSPSRVWPPRRYLPAWS